MRYLGVLGAILCLSACATVTMQPASMTTSLLAKDSALTKDAKSFTKLAQKEGWVEKSTAMEFLQSRIFVEGASVGPDQTGYADELQKKHPKLSVYSDALRADIDLAHTELAALNAGANRFLAGGVMQTSFRRNIRNSLYILMHFGRILILHTLNWLR